MTSELNRPPNFCFQSSGEVQRGYQPSIPGNKSLDRKKKKKSNVYNCDDQSFIQTWFTQQLNIRLTVHHK